MPWAALSTTALAQQVCREDGREEMSPVCVRVGAPKALMSPTLVAPMSAHTLGRCDWPILGISVSSPPCAHGCMCARAAFPSVCGSSSLRACIPVDISFMNGSACRRGSERRRRGPTRRARHWGRAAIGRGGASGSAAKGHQLVQGAELVRDRLQTSAGVLWPQWIVLADICKKENGWGVVGSLLCLSISSRKSARPY